jgi:hypothetical protein
MPSGGFSWNYTNYSLKWRFIPHSAEHLKNGMLRSRLKNNGLLPGTAVTVYRMKYVNKQFIVVMGGGLLGTENRHQ